MLNIFFNGAFDYFILYTMRNDFRIILVFIEYNCTRTMGGMVTGHTQLGTRRSKKCHVVFCIVHLLFTVKCSYFLQKEGHRNLLFLVQYNKKLTSNHGPQTFVVVRLKVILAGAVVTYMGSRCVTGHTKVVCHCACTVWSSGRLVMMMRRLYGTVEMSESNRRRISDASSFDEHSSRAPRMNKWCDGTG